VGDADGVGVTISAALCEDEAEGDGVLLATATGGAVGSRSLSYVTYPRASFTFFGKLSGSGVSERCFMTERTSGWKLGNT